MKSHVSFLFGNYFYYLFALVSKLEADLKLVFPHV